MLRKNEIRIIDKRNELSQRDKDYFGLERDRGYFKLEKAAIQEMLRLFIDTPDWDLGGLEKAVMRFADKLSVLAQHEDDTGASVRQFIIFGLEDDILERLPISTDRFKLSPSSDPKYIQVHDKLLAESMDIEKILITSALRRVRQGAQDILTSEYGDNVHIVDRQHHKSGAYSLHDNKLLKENVFFAQDAESRYKALQKLFGMEERSPYLAYPASPSIDAEGTEDMRYLPNFAKQFTLNGRMDFYTLKDVLTDPHSTVNLALKAVQGALRGLIFLKKHGLWLTDLDPSNIAIRPYSKTGFLFDYDGLIEHGVTSAYPTKRGYIPPSQVGAVYGEDSYPKSITLVEEKNLTHELSVVFKEIITRFDTGHTNKELKALVRLADDMREPDSGPGLSLEECLARLEPILASFERQAFEIFPVRENTPSAREELLSYTKTIPNGVRRQTIQAYDRHQNYVSSSDRARDPNKPPADAGSASPERAADSTLKGFNNDHSTFVDHRAQRRSAANTSDFSKGSTQPGRPNRSE